MLALFLAAAIGQVNVSDYLGYSETIHVQLEPYAICEDDTFVFPEDYSDYDEYVFDDSSGAPAGDGEPGAMMGNGGLAAIFVNQPQPGTMNIQLTLRSLPQAGRLVTITGQVVIGYYDVDDKEILELILPIAAILIPTNDTWTWTSGNIVGIPKGIVVTATFTGSGFTTGPGYWTCPGVMDSVMIR